MKKLFLLMNEEVEISLMTKLINKPIIEYPVLTSKRAGIDQVYLLAEEFDHEVEGVKVISKKEFVANIDKEDVLVFYGASMPLVKAKHLTKIFEKLDEGKYKLVVEEADKDAIIYGIKARDLLEEIKEDDFCIRKILKDMKNKGFDVRITNMNGAKQMLYVDSFETLSKADIFMRKQINKSYMKNGVFIENPYSVTIESGVEIGPGTWIESGVRILGNTKIGSNCHIGFNTFISDSVIHDNVDIYSSYIEKSEVEAYTNIGPYARLRPNAHLKEHVHIGNFVEVKNSELGNGTKAGHLAYIGDATLGENINIGCGVVFVNYDGKFKHRSVIEDGAFIGSNANIVAPVHVEKEGYIAAGSTITKDVKSGSLALERAERKDIDGYVQRKKERDARK